MGSLFLIRHATTEASASGRNLGQASDPPLAPAGEELAARLGRAIVGELRALAHDELRLVTSTARRCRETLDSAAAQLPDRVPAPVAEGALLEIDYGAWDGLTADECAARDPELRAAWERNPYDTRCPGGESGADVATRAFPVLTEVEAWLAGSRSRCALVVSHHHVIRLRVAAVLGLRMSDYRRRVSADPGGYAIITFGGQRPAVRRINAQPPA